MGFDKNKWKGILLKIENSWMYLPVENFKVRTDSKLNSIKFEEIKKRSISIWGDHYFEFEGNVILTDEIIPEIDLYYEEQLKKGIIKYVRFNRIGNLEIFVSSEVEFIIKVDITDEYPIEKWDFNYEKGYISF